VVLLEVVVAAVTVSTPLRISDEPLALDQILAVARHHQPATLSDDPAFRAHLERGPALLREALERGDIIYGVNTGFGGNVRLIIPDSEVRHHQENLLQFLSCGVGDPLPPEVVRAAMLLRANALARGYSAVRPVVIERLLELLNHDITPVVPRYGSVGASGDLCPSAYVARVLLGHGEVSIAARGPRPLPPCMPQASLPSAWRPRKVSRCSMARPP